MAVDVTSRPKKIGHLIFRVISLEALKNMCYLNVRRYFELSHSKNDFTLEKPVTLNTIRKKIEQWSMLKVNREVFIHFKQTIRAHGTLTAHQ